MSLFYADFDEFCKEKQDFIVDMSYVLIRYIK